MVDGRPARRSLWIFVLALTLTTAELGWWMVLNLRAAAAQRSDRLALLERDSALATRLIRDGEGKLAPEAWLARHFARLQWHCPQDGHADHKICSAMPRPQAISALHARYSAQRRMFVAEGASLLAMLLLGAYLMLRAMRREVAMLRQQSNFLAAVTHELKSPLASIRLAVETLQRRPPTPSVLARYLETLLSETVRLESLVNNVLMASRLSGPSRPNRRAQAPGAVDVAHELRAVLASMHDGSDAVRLVAPAQGLWVCIDAFDFQTIARNLIDNALKYAGKSEVIAVRLARVQHEVHLEVVDRGPGLSVAAQRRVFDKFFRVGDELSRSHGGSGLGLFLVRALAEAALGRAGVHSDGAGMGATFWVHLPGAPPAGREHRGAA